MKTNLTREGAVLRLVNHTLEWIHQDATGEVLRGMLKYGFTGFETMSDRQLDSELELRGLSEPGSLSIGEDEDPDGEDFDAGEQEIGELAPSPFLREAQASGDR